MILYADRGGVGLELTCHSKFLNTGFFIVWRCDKSGISVELAGAGLLL